MHSWYDYSSHILADNNRLELCLVLEKKVLEMVRPLLCDFGHNVVCLNNVCSKVKLTIIGTRLA